MPFIDSWIWLILIVAGLLMAILELLLGLDTQLDLVFIGSGFIVGGLLTWPFQSWVVSVLVAGAICIAYVAIGRKYVHRWTMARKEMTNVDAIIGKRGVALRDIGPDANGRVRVGAETWRAVSDSPVAAGEPVQVVDVKGVTLTVKKTGGN